MNRNAYGSREIQSPIGGSCFIVMVVGTNSSPCQQMSLDFFLGWNSFLDTYDVDYCQVKLIEYSLCFQLFNYKSMNLSLCDCSYLITLTTKQKFDKNSE